MKLSFFFALLMVAAMANAQEDSVQHSYGIKLFTGQVYAHTNAVNNVKGAKPFGLELEVATQQTNFKNFNRSSAYVKSGWALAYFNYNNNILGHGIIASRFIEPQYRITDRLLFLLKASIGAAYLSNPNDGFKNPTNNNYSLHFNPYLHVAGGIDFHVSKHASLAFIGSFHHISNGNLMQPNKGLNWVTGALSFNYYPGNNWLPKYRHYYDPFWQKEKAAIEAAIFYVPKQSYISKYAARRNFVLGLNTQITKQVGATSALTAGAEIYYDEFIVDDGKQQVTSKLVAAIQAGHVFLLGKVRFSQQLGYNVYSKLYFLPNFYTRLGIDYKLGNRYTVGGSLKANSDNADFFDLRLGYRF